jgi:signal transduction histidine kinase
MIGQLAALLRHALDAARVEEIALAEELRLLAAYVEIEQVRFADRLTVRWEIAPDVSRALVPNLLLQPLVENAIRHGIAPRAAPGAVTIAAWRAGEELVLTITDDGVGFGRAARPAGASILGADGEPRGTAGPTSGIGLATTRARLHHLYGPRRRASAGARSTAVERLTGDRRPSHHAPGERVTIEEPPGGGVRVSLRLPWRASAAVATAGEHGGPDPRARAPHRDVRVPPARRRHGASGSAARHADGRHP